MGNDRTESATLRALVFARKLQQAMDARGLNQAALAYRTGLSQSSICRMVSGARIPSVPTLQVLADALGVTMTQLWRG